MVVEMSEAGVEHPDVTSRRSWRAVAGLATTHRGYVSVAQLRESGVSRDAERWAIREGRLFIRPGKIYLVGHQYTAPDSRFVAALVAVGPGSTVSHRPAAAIWGLMRWTGDIDVTASIRSRGPRGVVVHHGSLNQRYEVTHRHGFAVTTLRRTIVDLAAVLDEPRLAAVINEAAIKGWLTKPFVRRLDAAMTGRRGAVALRRVLAARDRSDGWTRSSLEDAFAEFARESGLGRYERGKYVDIGDGDIRECDAMWRTQRVMVELDYLPIHETGYVPYRDRRRDRRLTAAGWRVFRITGDDLDHHRSETASDLRAALGIE